jgi:hypothetical protein
MNTKTKIALAAALVAIFAAPAMAYSTSDPAEIERNSGRYVTPTDAARGAFAQTPGIRNVDQGNVVVPFSAQERAWFDRQSSGKGGY